MDLLGLLLIRYALGRGHGILFEPARRGKAIASSEAGLSDIKIDVDVAVFSDRDGDRCRYIYRCRHRDIDADSDAGIDLGDIIHRDTDITVAVYTYINMHMKT